MSKVLYTREGNLQAKMKWKTILTCLSEHAQNNPEKEALRFWAEKETRTQCVTYGQLDCQARSVAALLAEHFLPGSRLLLLYPPGLDYIIAFLGCLYAGIIAVPAYPPRQNRHAARIEAMIADSQASGVLTTQSIQERCQQQKLFSLQFSDLQWLSPTEYASGSFHAQWRAPVIKSSTLAFLQYTSGSTTQPKGVMLSHRNLLANQEMIKQAFGHDETSIYVSWLPLFHDMGLIGNVLQALYINGRCILLSPLAFLQDPFHWLSTISQYQAHTSGGPNFAYNLCVRKISPEQREQLDLRSWKLAFNGAEPVNHETIEAFSSFFAPCGFRREAFYPCYGLAEAAVFVTGGFKDALPVALAVDSKALAKNQVVTARISQQHTQIRVGVGRSWQSEKIVIVDPATLTPCPEHTVGEIWVAGPHVAQGYWMRPEETKQTFDAYLAGSGDGPFLRTGDLGFLQDDELFVTGRLKDLIILRGSNYYPQDIELTVDTCCPQVRPGFGAAFSLSIENEERLVIVYEVPRQQRTDDDIQQIIRGIRQVVAEKHDLAVYAVVLVKTGQLPKTSSGKIQRGACLTAFLEGTLAIVGRSILQDESEVTAQEHITRDELLALAVEEQLLCLVTSLRIRLSRLVQISHAQLSADQPVNTLGLDSLLALEMAHSIEKDFSVSLSPGFLLQKITIQQLAELILTELSKNVLSGNFISRTSLSTDTRYPLSYGQQALWLTHHMALDKSVYNIAIATRVIGEIDTLALKRVFQGLVDRHHMLRTTFMYADDQLFQVIHSQIALPIVYEDATDWDEATLLKRLNAEAHYPFQLEHDPPFRVFVFLRSKEKHVILFVFHHIIVDLWSLTILFQELNITYQREVQGIPVVLEPLPLHYIDYVIRQQTQLAGWRGKQLEQYWRNYMENTSPLSLPSVRHHSSSPQYRGEAVRAVISSEVTQQLQALARDQGVTLYALLLAAFQLLLHRYTSQNEFLLATAVSGRSSADLTHLVGYLANPVIIQGKFTKNLSFLQLLQSVAQTVSEVFEHLDYPFPFLRKYLPADRHPGQTAPLQTMFVFQQIPSSGDQRFAALALGEGGIQVQLGNLHLETIELERRATPFDLMLTLAPYEGELIALLQYATEQFSHFFISGMLKDYVALLKSIVTYPEKKVGDFSLPSAQNQLALCQQKEDRKHRNGQRCITDIFETQAMLFPDRIALVCEDRYLTYREVNLRANQLSNYLRECGVGPEVLVGLFMERSLEIIIGILGILKAGGAYVPIEPTYSAQRISFILHDARIRLLLTRHAERDLLPPEPPSVICLDDDWGLISQQKAEKPAVPLCSQNLAYVIYTSGSTGYPKGVMVSHYHVVRLLEAAHKLFDFHHEDAWTLFHSFAFDFSVWEIWGALFYGGRLVIVPYQVSRAPDMFYQLLREEQITVLNQTPTAFHQILGIDERFSLDSLLKLRFVIFGGEALDLESLEPWFDKYGDEQPCLVNMYGITETTVHVTYKPIRKSDRGRGSVIGRPLPDLQVYVLDRYHQPVPIGMFGEFYIAGEGISRGYLHQPQLTGERFVPNHFSRDSFSILYKTGDTGRYLPDGELEYLERNDRQVKIRGFRIELGEIERVLERHDMVQKAVVIVHAFTPADKRLIAYIVPRRGIVLDYEALRLFARQHLPEYMMVAAFIAVEMLPLTANAKLDYKALPPPESIHTQIGIQHIAPQSEAERSIVAIWQDILHVGMIGIHDNFFQLGGHSLLLMQMQSRLHKVFDQEISLVQLLEYSTVSTLAAFFTRSSSPDDQLHQSTDRANRQRESRRNRRSFMRYKNSDR